MVFSRKQVIPVPIGRAATLTSQIKRTVQRIQSGVQNILESGLLTEQKHCSKFHV